MSRVILGILTIYSVTLLAVLGYKNDNKWSYIKPKLKDEQ